MAHRTAVDSMSETPTTETLATGENPSIENPSTPDFLVEDPIQAVLVEDDPPQAFDESTPIMARLVEPDPQPGMPIPPQRGIFRRLTSGCSSLIRICFSLASLIALLAVLTAIPIVQLITFGYLLTVAGGLASGSSIRNALPQFRQAGQIGLAAAAVFVAALPTQLLAHWESVATLIDPGSGKATAMRILAVASSVFATGYLLWAWVRGGRLKHYLWPQPIRFLREGWRWSTWRGAPDRLWDFTASLELPKYFWLGLRGAIGTLVWLIPAMIIVAALRNGETGLAGLVGTLSLILLGVGMLYLPMLQAHFAAERRLSALFEVREIRRCFRRAPWAWLFAMIMALVLTPVPLYLLKIEVTQQELLWLPCLVFVAFMLPARICTGLALRRARRRPEPQGWWSAISRWIVRLTMPLVVATYLLFVYVSQYTSWDGLAPWVQQHAVLIPVPFLSGV